MIIDSIVRSKSYGTRQSGPSSTVSGKRRPSLLAGLALAGMLLTGSSTQAQTISAVYPDGTKQFQGTNSLSFVASSSVAVTNVSVQLTMNNLSNKKTYTRVLYLPSLSPTGPANNLALSAPLFTNCFYTAVITMQDANGGTATQTVSFDTIPANAYVIEAEDYNYGSGQYFDWPQTNAYRNLAGVPDVDAHSTGSGGGSYRPHGTTNAVWSTEGCGDKTRAAYSGTGMTDYDVGFTSGGNWANFTRRIPQGDYYVYLRAARNDAGMGNNALQISVLSGTTTISGGGTGRFNIPSTGAWQTYATTPMTDSANAALLLSSDGSLTTLRWNLVGAGCNMNYVLLIPAVTNVIAADVAFTNMYPDGGKLYQPTNVASFEVTSSMTILPTDISVFLTATNLWTTNVSKAYTVANGLTVTSVSANDLIVSFPLASNASYNATFQCFDANGNAGSTNFAFTTVDPASYSIECADFNYGGGQWLDFPNTNLLNTAAEDGSYMLYPGVSGIDFNANSGLRGLNTEGCGDKRRAPWDNTGFQDMDIGDNQGGEWANYTRRLPGTTNDTYNVWLRAASPNNNASVSIAVVADATVGSQSVNKLGTCAIPNTGGWQTYAFVPCKDINNRLVRIKGGSVTTLRMTIENGGCNEHFILLTPVDPVLVPPPTVDGFTPDGSAMFQPSNNVTFVVHSDAGVTASNIKLTIDGVNLTDFTTAGTRNLLNVSHPVSPNGLHAVTVTVTDANGSCTNTARFNTFSSSSYVIEAEDFNYTDINTGLTGQFVDGVVNGYKDRPATQGIDAFSQPNNLTPNNTAYRNSGTNAPINSGMNTENCSDNLAISHAGFTPGNQDLGSSSTGNWGNYTHNYPPGTYNIYLRAAAQGNSGKGSAGLVLSGWGTANQTVTNLGSFDAVNTGGWQTYTWSPCKDGSGNLSKVTLAGTTNTLRFTMGGAYNADYYVLVPEFTGVPSAANVYPNGATMFQGTNKFTFDAISSSGINTNTIVVTVNGVVVSNLVITGSSTLWHVAYSGLQSNTYYTVTYSFQNTVGNPYTSTVSFDTFAAGYQWEAEDWDFNYGHFVDGQVDAYAGKVAIEGVDVQQSIWNTSVPFVYYPYDPNNPAPGTDVNNDVPRAQFGSQLDYRVNWFGGGSWCNYTHHYPSGSYNILGRFTEGSETVNITMSKVISGWGTTSQSVAQLGNFVIPNLGWMTWQSVYLTDGSGKPVTVTFDGSQTTLRMSADQLTTGQTINAGFFMLVPVSAPVTPVSPSISAVKSGGNINITFATQSNFSYQVLYKNNLSDATWTPLGSAVSGNGAVQSVPAPASGTSRFYRVSVQ